MDLIASLTEKLGIEGEQAEALAGAVLGGVKEQVAASVGTAEAQQMGQAIPELDGWTAKAEALAGDGGQPPGGGGLFGAAASALGGGGAGGLLGALGGGGGGADVAMIVDVLGKLGLNEGLATMVAPMALEFLKDRLPEGLLEKVTGAVPMLSALGGGGGAAGSVASALGGLLGKD